jgi:hypothetical protein
MSEVPADLFYDPNDIGPGGLLSSFISLGPRADDETLDPKVGDHVELVDHDKVRLRGRVTGRVGDRVTVQVDLPAALSQTA